MTDSADIDAYCARIGYSGAREPCLAVLQALVAAHTVAIPFENLDVLLKRPIRLDRPSLYRKLVRERRGGYCFEHNLLLLDVLTRFGFRAVGLAARVQWGRAPGAVGPRTHMLLRVDLPDSLYLADVGFGGLTPTAPLALAPGPEQATPHETFRLVAAEGEFDLEARLGGAWASLYRFSLQPQFPVDYEVANWFTSTHPASLFVNHLIASRATAGRRHALFNNRYTVRGRDGGIERKVLPDAAALHSILDREFGIAMPEPDIAAIAALAEANAAQPSPFDGGQ
ncbi:MAG TPA: arylamine N-acetyltransferase [Stellaceae bacterium]|jgi:N-hydroxyarylamine O-acetyltransferase